MTPLELNALIRAINEFTFYAKFNEGARAVKIDQVVDGYTFDIVSRVRFQHEINQQKFWNILELPDTIHPLNYTNATSTGIQISRCYYDFIGVTSEPHLPYFDDF